MAEHRRIIRLAAAFAIAGGLAGCTHHVIVEPITVEPIHLTVDVRLQVDRQLDQFFDFEEHPAPDATTPSDSSTGGVS